VGFGNRGVIAGNDPIEQETAMKFNALLTNAVVFHYALDIAEIVRQLLREGWVIDPEDLARISPYLTEHINRFGEYSAHVTLPHLESASHWGGQDPRRALSSQFSGTLR
jgi:hypothetical protein